MHNVTSDKTIIGVGSTGALIGGGLNDFSDGVNNPGRVDFSGPLGRMVQRDNILVDCNHQIEVRGTVADPRTFYPYTAGSAASVPTIVPAGAGIGKV